MVILRGSAVVVVSLAVCTAEARLARAGVGIDVVGAIRAVAARVGGALIDVVLAVIASKAVYTATGVGSDLINTGPAI